jgi:hypothetical protein
MRTNISHINSEDILGFRSLHQPTHKNTHLGRRAVRRPLRHFSLRQRTRASRSKATHTDRICVAAAVRSRQRPLVQPSACAHSRRRPPTQLPPRGYAPMACAALPPPTGLLAQHATRLPVQRAVRAAARRAWAAWHRHLSRIDTHTLCVAAVDPNNPHKAATEGERAGAGE